MAGQGGETRWSCLRGHGGSRGAASWPRDCPPNLEPHLLAGRAGGGLEASSSRAARMGKQRCAPRPGALGGGLVGHPPTPFAGLGPQLLSPRQGPGSWLLIGARDLNLSRPEKLRSWAWLRVGRDPRPSTGSLPGSHRSYPAALPSSPHSPLSSQSFHPGLGASPPQLFLFLNCTVWPAAAPSVGDLGQIGDGSTVPNRVLLVWMGVGFLGPDCQG